MEGNRRRRRNRPLPRRRRRQVVVVGVAGGLENEGVDWDALELEPEPQGEGQNQNQNVDVEPNAGPAGDQGDGEGDDQEGDGGANAVPVPAVGDPDPGQLGDIIVEPLEPQPGASGAQAPMDQDEDEDDQNQPQPFLYDPGPAFVITPGAPATVEHIAASLVPVYEVLRQMKTTILDSKTEFQGAKQDLLDALKVTDSQVNLGVEMVILNRTKLDDFLTAFTQHSAAMEGLGRALEETKEGLRNEVGERERQEASLRGEVTNLRMELETEKECSRRESHEIQKTLMGVVEEMGKLREEERGKREEMQKAMQLEFEEKLGEWEEGFRRELKRLREELNERKGTPPGEENLKMNPEDNTLKGELLEQLGKLQEEAQLKLKGELEENRARELDQVTDKLLQEMAVALANQIKDADGKRRKWEEEAEMREKSLKETLTEEFNVWGATLKKTVKGGQIREDKLRKEMKGRVDTLAKKFAEERAQLDRKVHRQIHEVGVTLKTLRSEFEAEREERRTDGNERMDQVKAGEEEPSMTESDKPTPSSPSPPSSVTTEHVDSDNEGEAEEPANTSIPGPAMVAPSAPAIPPVVIDLTEGEADATQEESENGTGPEPDAGSPDDNRILTDAEVAQACQALEVRNRYNPRTKPFPCSFCPRSYSYDAQLRNHAERVHAIKFKIAAASIRVTDTDNNPATPGTSLESRGMSMPMPQLPTAVGPSSNAPPQAINQRRANSIAGPGNSGNARLRKVQEHGKHPSHPLHCLCGMDFKSSLQMGDHIRSVTGRNLLKCKDCGMQFVLATKLGIHVQQCPKGTKKAHGMEKSKSKKLDGSRAIRGAGLERKRIPNRKCTGERTTAKTSSTEKLYCFCKKEDDGSSMIQCEAKNCAMDWFHFSCVGITVKPKGKWYCSQCLANVEQPQA